MLRGSDVSASLLARRCAVAALALATGPLAGCAGRAVLQSALVPLAEPAPPPTSHGAGDVYAAASGLSFFAPTGEPDLGHHVPAAQLHVAATVRPRSGWTLRPLAVLAIPEGATPLALDIGLRPREPSVSAGLDVGYVIGSERTGYLVRPHVGIAVLGVAMRIEDPEGTSPHRDLGWMAVIEGGLDGGYWVASWLLLTAGIDLRNAPRVPSRIALFDGDEPPVVRFGAFALAVRVAAEIELEHAVGIVLAASVPALGSPFEPYPILTLGLRAIFGDAPARQFFERNEGGMLGARGG